MDTLEKLNKKILEIELHNITPFLSHGANKELEFRIPELKAAMRYWWRAFQWYDSVEDMKKDEEKYFGSQRKKSPILLIPKICTSEKNDNEKIKTSYNSKIFKIPSLQNISCMIDMQNKLEEGERNFPYANLLELVSILGGLGGRSRKGYGAFYIHTKEEDKQKYKLLNGQIPLTRDKLVEQIKQDIKCITRDIECITNDTEDRKTKVLKGEIKIQPKSEEPKYLYIEKIMVGKLISQTEFFKRIAEAVTNSKGQVKDCDFEKKRQPMVISCYNITNNKKKVEMVFPIISFFHYANENRDSYKKFCQNFIDTILN